MTMTKCKAVVRTALKALRWGVIIVCIGIGVYIALWNIAVSISDY